MEIQAIWIVDLPLKFSIGNHFKKTTLDKFSFRIRKVDIELLKDASNNFIDKAKIKLVDEYDNLYLPSYENISYLSKFYEDITYRAGTAIQDFMDGFSRYSNDQYYQIFDG